MSTRLVRLASAKAPHPPVCAVDDTYIRELWFKTEPLDRATCNRIVELQLNTFSCDQGWVGNKEQGSWSWFEISIFADEHATEPRKNKYGDNLTYRSHCNIMHPDEEVEDQFASHFGNVFDRRDDLIIELEEGNVLAVRVCARFQAWENKANEGELIARVLQTDPSSMSWSLKSGHTPNETPNINGSHGLFTLTPAGECTVGATDSQVVSKIWFTSPVLSQRVAPNVEEIQLFTTAHNQGFGDPDQGMWTWFDIMILDSPKATTPKIGEDGRALVWKSHEIHVNTDQKYPPEQAGPTFDRSHELLRSLKVGDIIAVRVCARFDQWTSYARDARLLVKINNEAKDLPPMEEPYIVDWKAVTDLKTELEEATAAFLQGPEGSMAKSQIKTALGQEVRSDKTYGAGGRKLRLLSLDGGGVRGISALYILQEIMKDVAGDKNAKPCDYFDMICGTSTGGLIAIMLGRLRMSIPDCITEYNKLSRQIFPAPEQAKEDDGYLSKGLGWVKNKVNVGGKAFGFVSSGAQYDANKLIDAVKLVVKNKCPSGNPDEKMKESQEGDCKVFVVSCNANALNNDEAVHLRTYTHPDFLDKTDLGNCKIWEAAQATAAAPGYFHRAEIGENTLVDGGLGYNNPVLLLLGEALTYYGFARPVGVLVTIGTGMKPNIVLPEEGSGFTGVAKNVTAGISGYKTALADLTTNSEGTAIVASRILPKDLYYRFNVGTKTKTGDWEAPIDLANWQGMDKLTQQTLEYIGSGEEVKRVEKCRAALPPKHVKSA